jgi:endonuclease YncB( thermonuclease family)
MSQSRPLIGPSNGSSAFRRPASGANRNQPASEPPATHRRTFAAMRNGERCAATETAKQIRSCRPTFPGAWSTSLVVSVLDDDTIEVPHNHQPECIRLNGIDCPEKSHAYGKRTKQAASALVYGKEVTLQTFGKDSVDRLPCGRDHFANVVCSCLTLLAVEGLIRLLRLKVIRTTEREDHRTRTDSSPNQIVTDCYCGSSVILTKTGPDRDLIWPAFRTDPMRGSCFLPSEQLFPDRLVF